MENLTNLLGHGSDSQVSIQHVCNVGLSSTNIVLTYLIQLAVAKQFRETAVAHTNHRAL